MRSIPQSIKEKIDKQNQTVYENANPFMNVTVARARNTVMDSSYWVVETIRQKSRLGDVSLAPRRQKVTGPPNRIYEIHVNDGVVGTSIREYPDKFKDRWVNQFDVGPGSSVAIAFDGEWERYRNVWRLITHEKPWIFWVDNSGVLWAQLWDDAGTKQQLATGVVYCRAIRAWKNLNMADKDQGIIVGYIKSDGKVYYRNYCQLLDLSYTWEPERQVTEFTGTALSLNLFITNDYRMGFVIEDSLNDIYWYITDRNWAGMAIAAETLTVGPASLDIDFIPIEYIGAYAEESLTVAPSEIDVEMLFGRTDNTIVELINVAETRLDEELEPYEDYGFRIKVRLNYETMEAPTFSLTDATTLSNIPIGSVSISEAGYEFVIHIDESLLEFGINDVVGDVNISISNFTNEAGYNYDNINSSFTPVNLIPSAIPLPEVEVIFNE